MNRYNNYNNNNHDNESDCLISPVTKVRLSSEKIQSLGKGVLWNRIIIGIVLVLLCIDTLYSQSQISQLSLQLEDVNVYIKDLQTITQQHSVVIERFNSSITNHDIIHQLNDLQKKLISTTHALHTELEQTKNDIQIELLNTIRILNETVDMAETEIYDQVEKVKKDVEQYVISTQDQFSMENSFMVYQLAGTFTILSCLISMWHMTGHLRKLHQPTIQRKILAILWMSPIYAITSWFSLVFHSAAGYLAIIKDFYEAYVIYQFLSFCIAVLGKGDRNVVVDLLANHASHLTPPFRFLSCCEVMTCGRCCIAPKYESPRQLADAILLQCQLFAIQFVFLRPLTTTAMVLCEKMNYYGPIINTHQLDDTFDTSSSSSSFNQFNSPQFYITILQNISIFVAFTGLLKFYHAVDQELAWCRPFAKFLCIKGVVFMTFWQGLALSVLAQTTDLGKSSNSNNSADADEWAKSAQNFLICLEMLLFSIAHFYCFPTEEWEDGYRVKHNADGNFGDSIALGDFLADLKLIIKNGKTKKLKKNNSTSPTNKYNPTIPEGDDESDNTNQTSDMTTSSTTNNTNNIINNHHQLVGDTNDNDDINSTYDDSVSDTIEEDNSSRLIARALQDSLGELADDPEIAEATKRLLDSKVLLPSFFDYAHSTSSIGNENNDNKNDINDANSDIHMTPKREKNRIEADIDALISEFTSPTVPTEQTTLLPSSSISTPSTSSSLLSSSAATTPSLRPSIFTTVASIAESEDPER
jgi:hypothetical protein